MARRRKTAEERQAEMDAIDAIWDAELAAREADTGYDIGYADGVLPDGRAWQAEVIGDTQEPAWALLMLNFAVGDDADWSPMDLLRMVIDAGLVIPLAPVLWDYQCERKENHDDPPLPVWWVYLTLRDAEGEWAELGFALQPPLPDGEYAWH